MTTRKKYAERTDLERIESQWRKLTGLHTREEWSSAVVRAATAAEVAANLAIRREFHARSSFEDSLVNQLLRSANGLNGKMNRLLLPLYTGTKSQKTAEKLKKAAETITQKRNAVVHVGEFCNEDEARGVIKEAKKFVETLVRIYEPEFKLKERN